MTIIDQLQNQNKMSLIDKSIANYFLNETDTLSQVSSHQIAEHLYTSPSTIVRFCQKIGFNGFTDFRQAYFKELKYLIKEASNTDFNHPFAPQDASLILGGKIGKLYQETIDETFSLLEEQPLKKVTEVLGSANVIYMGAAGDLLEPAKIFKNKLLKIGLKVVVEERLDHLFLNAEFANKDDVFILLSYTGELERIVRTAKKNSKKENSTDCFNISGE